MPAYHEAFLTGEVVRVADAETLLPFQQDWAYHHPLQEEQLAYAGRTCFVRRVGYWHGGDCLYELGTWVLNTPTSRYSQKEAVTGLWHEACLREPDMTQWQIPLSVADQVYTVAAESRNGQSIVVVRTIEGVECLIIRHLQNEREAEAMTQVAALRNTLSFERRYHFQGVAQDALHRRFQEQQKLRENST